jgi:hypothetical protein
MGSGHLRLTMMGLAHVCSVIDSYITLILCGEILEKLLIISLLMSPHAGAQAFLMDYPQGEWGITH